MNILRKSLILLIFSSITLIFAQPVTLSFADVDIDAGTVEVYMQNEEDVYGFQFTVTNINLISAAGGSAQDVGFIVSTNTSGLVLGFSLTGAFIPAGEGVLTILNVDGLVDPDESLCYTGSTFSGAGGVGIDVDESTCWPEAVQIDAPTNLTAVGGGGVINLSWDAVNADGSRADVTLWVSEVTDTNIEFTMNNTSDVYGFQFNILADELLGAAYGSASGGSAQDMGFIVSTNSEGLVLGFSLTGAFIPAGESVLTNVAWTPTGTDAFIDLSITNFAGEGGSALSYETGDPLCYGICIEPTVYLYNLYRDGELFAGDLDMTDHFDDGLGYSETHCYTVTATDGENESDQSNEACATTDPLLGCTDPEANNYCEECTEDDGSCEYDTLDAPTNLTAVGGDGMISLGWDAVNADGSRADVTLSVSAASETSLEFYMSSTADVYGFQFNILADEALGASFGSASGGLAQSAGFLASTNASGLVLGFSLTGGFIPAGEGVLTNVEWTHTGMDAFIDLAIDNFAGDGGVALSTETGAPFCYGTCIEPTVITYNLYRDGDMYMADLDMVNYDDMDLGYSETHCYTVTATDGENESDQSNEACATTNEEVILIDAPTNLTAVGGDGMISLGWDAVNADGSRADVTLWVSDVTDTNIEFTMNNTTNVYGFQFNILADDVLGATYGSASGGSSQDMGFILTNATGAVLGFSLTGAFIPAGESVLTNVAWTPTGTDAFIDLSITNFAGEGGSALSYETGAPFCYGTCIEPTVITYNLYRDGDMYMADLDMVDYDDMDLGYSETHCYTVTATDGENESDHSNEACATTDEEDILPDAPTNLTAVGGDGMISLDWDAINADGSRADVTLWISEITDTNIELSMTNTADVYGFQFTLMADEVLGAVYGNTGTGGSAAAAGFSVAVSPATGVVLGFSFVGSAIPAGEGVLTNVAWTATGIDGFMDIDVTNFAGVGGSALSYETGDHVCYGENCVEPLVITYNVYRDGNLHAEDLNDTQFIDDGLNPLETHCYTVTAFDQTNESDHSNEACATTNSAEDMYAPVNLTATGGAGYVDVEWFDGTPAESQWISYDDGINNDSIGTGEAADFDVAIRFEADDMAPFYGSQLTQVSFFPREVACTYSIRVWIGGSAYNSGTLVVDQAVTPDIDTWNIVQLDTPVDIEPGLELWFGYRANTTTGYPAGCDVGPAMVGYGDLILFGGAWVSMSDSYGLDYNWNLQGFVSSGGGDPVALTPIIDSDRVNTTDDMVSGNMPTVQDNIFEPGTDNTRSFLGYNVYRDGLEVEFTNNTEYHDTNVADGVEYCYYATAVYDGGESNQSNEDCATPLITEVLPPIALTAEGGDGYVDLEWLEPAPAGENELLYWDGPLSNAFYFYDTFEAGYAHGTKFEVDGPYDLMAASTKILSSGDQYWPWPNSTHGPVRVIVLDDNNGQPGNVIFDEETVAEDGWATVYPNMMGLEGTFYVVVSHTLNWQDGGDAEGFGIDGAVDYPNNMVTMEAGNWSTGDPLEYGGDYMFSALVSSFGTVQQLGYFDDSDVETFADPTVVTSIHDGSWAPVEGPESHPVYHFDVNRVLTGYNVYQDGTLIGSTDVGDTSYRDEPLNNGTEYCYTVTAEYDEGESGPSNEACATPSIALPNAPTNLTAEGGDAVVHLAWNEPDGETNPDAYNVGFEDGEIPNGWDNIDDDGDGYAWEIKEGVNAWVPHSGDFCIASASYINDIGALTPDNWLITPSLTPTAGSEFIYWVAAADPNWALDHIEVRVSTTGTDPSDFSIEVDDYTPPAGSSDWVERTIDLSDFADQMIYIAIRHNDSYDWYHIKIDDISITNLSDGAVFSADFETPSDLDKFTVRSSNEDLPIRIDDNLSDDEIDQLLAEYIENNQNNQEIYTRIVEQYFVHRSTTQGGPYDLIDITDAETLTYDDTSVANGTTYHYVVSALHDSGLESDYSNEASAMPEEEIPFPPTELTAVAGDGIVDLAWIAPEGADTGGWPPCPDGTAQYVDCAGTCFDNEDCADATYDGCVDGDVTWLGDGFCDDGTYGLVLDCEEYNFDYGDCGETECNSLDEFNVEDYGCYDDNGEMSNAYSITWNAGCELTILAYGADDVYENVFDLTGQGFSSGITFYGFGPNEENMFMIEAGSIQSDIVTASTGPEDCAGGGDRMIGFTDLHQTSDKVFTPGSADRNTRDLEGYNVYRSLVSGSGFSVIETTDPSVTEYTDTDVTNGTTYYYVVTALYSGGVESQDSNEASATPMGSVLMSLSDAAGNAGENVTVTLSMTNDGLVGGVQVDLIDVPDYLVIDSVEGSARVPGDWALSTSEMNDGVSRILGFSFTGTTIAAGEGPIFDLTFSTSMVGQPAEVSLCTVNEVISDENGIGYGATPGCGTVTLIPDGIEVMISSGTEAVDQGGMVDISVDIDNDDPIYGFELHLGDLPESVTAIDVVPSARIPEPAFFSFSDNNGELTALWFSLTLVPIEPGTGELFTVTYQVNEDAPNGTTELFMNPELSVFSDEIGQSMFYTSNVGTIEVGLPDVRLSLVQTADDTFEVHMNNNDQVAGFQMDIQDLPDYYSFASAAGTARLPDGWNITGSELDGNFRLLGFSFNGSVISAGTGAVVTVTMNVNAPDDSETDVCFTSAIVSDETGSPYFTATECGVFFNPFGGGEETQDIVVNPFMNNMISFYVAAEDMSTDTVLGDDFLIASDDSGNFYVPAYAIDGIGTLSNTEGYKVFVNGQSPVTVSVTGPMMDAGSVYGWSPFMKNMFGYPFSSGMSAMDAFGSYHDDILIISDDSGGFYVPSLNIFTLTNLEPGEGYEVFVNGPNMVDFVYPMGGGLANGARLSDNEFDEQYKLESQSQQYDIVQTGDAYAIILTEMNGMIEAGDEVAVYAYGEVVGATRIIDANKPLVIAAWKAFDEYGFELPGFETGDPIELRVWSQNQNRELYVSADLNNNWFGMSPLTSGSIVVTNEDAIPTTFELGQNYPNPFNPSTTIDFTIPADMKISLTVFDITGRQIRTLVSGQFTTQGYHSILWDGKDANGSEVSAGLYIYTLNGNGFNDTKKMVMLK
jgi:fibronectin type 3 domain-containing protein